MAKVVPYDPDREREAQRKGLPALIAAAIPILEGRGGAVQMRTARLLRQLQKSSVDDAYLDAGTARRYVLREYGHEKVDPSEVASSAERQALDASRTANGDPERFADEMMHVSVGIFHGIQEIHRLYTINGEEYRSAILLHEWAMERQGDPNSVLYAHLE